MEKEQTNLTIDSQLLNRNFKWLVTGVAGFIGSNILEQLLKLNQSVIGIDNFATGKKSNLLDVESCVGKDRWRNFNFVNLDLRDELGCMRVCEDVDFVIHQAALGSVPRSVKNPLLTNSVNVTGFLNLLYAAKEAGCRNFTYASSSSVYGDSTSLPKKEEKIGSPLSNYALTKLTNEQYSEVFSRTYDFHPIGLRYFNVFGRRQDPIGEYAAVIPKWIVARLNGEDIEINGDGTTSRDFCFVERVVQANISASLKGGRTSSEVINVGMGQKTDLNTLLGHIDKILERRGVKIRGKVVYKDFRVGDVKHSLADLTKLKRELRLDREFDFYESLQNTIEWYIEKYS